jgi:hypothetical protein
MILLRKVTLQTRGVSEAEWRLMSTNPDTMVDKVFSLLNECGSNEDMVYNISSHHFKKGQGELMKSDSPVVLVPWT